MVLAQAQAPGSLRHTGQGPPSPEPYPEVQDALEKAIANNGVPVGEPARPKIKGAAAGGPPRHEKPPPAQPPALPTIPPAPSVEDSEEEEEEIHPNCFIDDPPVPALSPTLQVSSNNNNSDPDPTLKAIADRVKALERQSQMGPRITVSAIAAAAIRGDIRVAAAAVCQDYEKFRDKIERPHMSKQDILERLPKVLHPLYQGFDPKEADELPELQGDLNHKIELKPDDTGQPPKPSSQRLRPISRDKARAVKLYVNNMMKKGHVERSTSA
ncbi:hypothetical protein CFE70_000977 [Pyrenophora teres f. teres 0-1]